MILVGRSFFSVLLRLSHYENTVIDQLLFIIPSIPLGETFQCMLGMNKKSNAFLRTYFHTIFIFSNMYSRILNTVETTLQSYVR